MGSIFGKGNEPSNKKSVANINAGGLTSQFRNQTINLSSSAGRKGLVGSIAATFPEQAAFLRGQRELVAPGVGALSSSRLAGVEASRSRAVGNLRENLANRRVLGSSFGSDALARTELEFQQEADRVRAESFLTELELSNQLAQQEFAARRGQYQTFLDELNIQAEIATQLASDATSQLGANARMKAELDANAAAGFGQFVGTVFGF